MLPSRAAADPDRLRRFEKEVRSASSLNHPNVVTVFEIGESDGTCSRPRLEGEILRLPPDRSLPSPGQRGWRPLHRLEYDRALGTRAIFGVSGSGAAGGNRRKLVRAVGS